MGSENRSGKVPLISKIAYGFGDFLYRCIWNQYGSSVCTDAVFPILGCH